jgi:hypothetical protein
MLMKLISITTPYFLSALIVLVSAYWGLSRALGAHPFWATKVALIGVPIGLALALIVRRKAWATRLSGFLVLLVMAGFAAHFGRLRFAASFAEDTLAGQFWFFGWIAVAVASTALIAALLTPKVRET